MHLSNRPAHGALQEETFPGTPQPLTSAQSAQVPEAVQRLLDVFVDRGFAIKVPCTELPPFTFHLHPAVCITVSYCMGLTPGSFSLHPAILFLMLPYHATEAFIAVSCRFSKRFNCQLANMFAIACFYAGMSKCSWILVAIHTSLCSRHLELKLICFAGSSHSRCNSNQQEQWWWELQRAARGTSKPLG